jgi:hypothetical protein
MKTERPPNEPRKPIAAGLHPASILAVCLSLSALLLLAPRASATPFSFSTGIPDGKIATLSGPASAGFSETETADDFVLSECVLINGATFTGLLPTGTPLTSVNSVEVEIYHVFPDDSDVGRTSGSPLFSTVNVPTRVNSPADHEIDSATRDSSNGSLSFPLPSLLSPNFPALNSVVSGIHPKPGQTTGGDGGVTGEEVLITVTFDPPILLPADHYFFRPEVGVVGGNFLWLSAPKTLATDLQSWIRNDGIVPDWLRIGTDIVGPPAAFNATFSLSGVMGAMSIIDELVPCSGPASGGTWKNHGQYVSSVAHAANRLANLGCINQNEKGKIVSVAARSDCGKKPKNHPNNHSNKNKNKHH